MPLSRRLAPLLAALPLVAGCLSGAPGGTAPTPTTPGALTFDPEWAFKALDFGNDHNHRDPLQHENRSTPNFEILGWDPLVTDTYGRTSGGHLCGDTTEKAGRRLSVIHSWVSDIAAIVVDVTDATAPKKLGEFVLTTAHAYDVGMTPDQKWVLLATDAGGGTPASGVAPIDGGGLSWRDACTGTETLLAGPENGLPMREGVVLVDISNPSAPTFADYLFLGGGHSIQVKDLGGRTFALVTTTTFGLIEVTAQGRLVPSSFFVNCGGQVPACVNYHDGALQIHPKTKQKLAYIGTTGAVGVFPGIAVFDVANPNTPQRVGGWNDWAALGNQITPTFVHEILPLEVLIDGRHYTFVGEECGGRQRNTPTCMVAMLDTTDLSKITAVGAWTLPIDIQWSGGLLFSLHYVGWSNGTLFVSNYHGGLWAVDVSTPAAMKTMPTIGVFQPTNVSPKPIGKATSYDYAPAVLDVNPLSDGTLITYDHTSGIYALRFDASQPAPPPPPWPLSK